MTNTVKVTKKDVLNAIATVITEDFEVQVGDVTVTAEDVNAYIEKTINQLNAKNEKARERAAEKKTEGDNIYKVVAENVTEEWKTVNDITEKVKEVEGFETITSAKVVARLTQLVKNNVIYKTQIKTENGRKLMAYSTTAPAEE